MRVLLGPLLFVTDVAPANIWIGVLLCIALVPSILLFPLRPRLWSAVISACALLAWVLLGIMGCGVGC